MADSDALLLWTEHNEPPEYNVRSIKEAGKGKGPWTMQGHQAQGATQRDKVGNSLSQQ